LKFCRTKNPDALELVCAFAAKANPAADQFRTDKIDAQKLEQFLENRRRD
jgi:hypothetical protein